MQFNEISLNIEDKSRPIVILDSGKGGLYVLEELSKKLPVENFVFINDNKFLPYGDKDPKILRRHFARIIKKVKILNPKAIVLACNTMDTLAGDDFDAAFVTSPVYHIVAPTAKKALENTKNNKIALLATENTIEGQKYMYSMPGKNLSLYGIECLNLASAIEHDQDVKKTLEEEIKSLETLDFDTIILGCTHYHYIEGIIQRKYEDIKIIDSANILIDEVVTKFPENIRNRAEKQKKYIILTEENEKLKEKINLTFRENVIMLVENI